MEIIQQCCAILWSNLWETYSFYFLIQVMMKDLVTPIPPEDMYGIVKKCLENASLMNYTKVTEMAKAEGDYKFFSLVCCSFLTGV
jgi:hypothetical protein